MSTPWTKGAERYEPAPRKDGKTLVRVNPEDESDLDAYLGDLMDRAPKEFWDDLDAIIKSNGGK